MKRTLIVALSLATAATFAPAVSAATKEPVKNCTKATARPHAAPSVAQPKTIAKSLPTTFTFFCHKGVFFSFVFVCMWCYVHVDNIQEKKSFSAAVLPAFLGALLQIS